MGDLQPPDHMDAVKLEQDGDLNLHYRKELLLGNLKHHDEFDSLSNNADNDISKLKQVFFLADINNDSYVDAEELNKWIVGKVQGHLKDSDEGNEEIFNHLDTDHDGNVTWTEFNIHFLLAKGYSLEKAVRLSSSSRGGVDDDKESLIRYRFRWVDADEEGEFGALNLRELINFRHPEQSPLMIQKMALDLLEKFDMDEDGVITEYEFVNPTYRFQPEELDEETKKQRSLEFKNSIDQNRDGVVNLEELKLYVDPRNLNRILSETQNLILMSDEDGDGRLSLAEVLENSELFLGSKMIDASRNFHDEF
ncbi:hypothetical protein HELRODRAFT_89801 [Helobdella robusta]|uniref:45 kDa calcium-binding protein n=1 Tax=Helobdella robusta TaxID=6412 RepID=T1G7H8_HELRO|nr:hypothetical protein HELRODRAFT_89801 [Helobdella robusta]ESN92198.1 hypothetical protein HELRODRAFT_89801 [Helobdella robusta]